MDLLSDVFNDLIKDLNSWRKKDNKDDSVIDRLESLKETLEDEISMIETEIRIQEQDSSWYYDERNENYE